MTPRQLAIGCILVLLGPASLLSACEISGDVLSAGPSLPPAAAGAGGTVLDVTFPAAVSSLAAGDSHTCFISEERLFCFGEGGDGALGSGNLQSQLAPRAATVVGTPLEVRTGARMTCLLFEGGGVSCTGAGTSGQLGNGAFVDSPSFVAVGLARPSVALAAGDDHVCAILDDATLWCWGANAEGQLAQDDPFPGPGVPAAEPRQVGAVANWAQVSGGQGHTCGVQRDGTLWCWGRNSTNELGLGDAYDDQIRSPAQVGTDSDWQLVEAGQNHTCGLRTGGQVDCWGGNDSGQLGTGDLVSRDVPTRVFDGRAQAIALDVFHTCVLGGEGVSCAGRGDEGALGNGTEDQLDLRVMEGSSGAQTIAVAAFHSCVAFEVGVSCTGLNDDGRLGVGDTMRRSTLTPVIAPDE